MKARVVLGAVLLLPAIYFTWLTIDGLAARRALRTDLTEITHVRYGLLSADRWRDIISPLLNKQIDKIDLNSQRGNLRPTVERSLYRLLDAIKTQMSAKPAEPKPGEAPKPPVPGMGNAMMVGMIFGALRPHVPEYTETVMAELGKTENQKGFKEAIRSVVIDGVKNTFGAVDMTTYNAILKAHHCADGAACEQLLNQQVHEADERVTKFYLAVLLSAALGIAIVAIGEDVLSVGAVVVLMLFCLAMLAGGVLSPMIEVEARITSMTATFLGNPISFGEQSIYFRSKSVLEVFQTLISMGRPEMWVVGVLVLLFSVVFPLLKMVAVTVCLFRPEWLRTSRVMKFFALDISKWSMADVMALAIFMSFVAFNGLIGTAMEAMNGSIGNVAIPTNSSKILPGYYLFIGFCLASIYLSKKLERGIAK